MNARIEKLERLAHAMDSAFVIPGTSIRIGWEAIIGLIPGIGDSATALISCYIVREAHLEGASLWLKARMVWNILIDWIVGSIPLVGDIFDIGWKANRRNVALLKRHIANPSS